MIENFETAMRFIFFFEKYMSNDPDDPGGLTIWGICERDYPQAIKEMSAMNESDAKAYARDFYKDTFWDAIKGDTLPDLMDIVLLNSAINQGISIALNIRYHAIDWRDAILLASDRYDDLKNYKLFGKGWNKRLVSLRDYIASYFTVLEWDKPEMVKAMR